MTNVISSHTRMFFSQNSKKSLIDESVNALFTVPTPAVLSAAPSTIIESVVQNGTDSVVPNFTLSAQLLSNKDAEAEAQRKPRHKAIEAMKVEKDKKTLFIGNVPVTVHADKKILRDFKVLFSQFGKIDSIRFRSIVISLLN